MRGGRKLVDPSAYADMDEFWSDIATAYQQEVDDLAVVGCEYLQIDDVSFAYLCGPEIRAQIAADGEDPARLPLLYGKVLNALVAKGPKEMSVTIHIERIASETWPAAGSEDAELGVMIEPEVCHGTTEVHARVQG